MFDLVLNLVDYRRGENTMSLREGTIWIFRGLNSLCPDLRVKELYQEMFHVHGSLPRKATHMISMVVKPADVWAVLRHGVRGSQRFPVCCCSTLLHAPFCLPGHTGQLGSLETHCTDRRK